MSDERCRCGDTDAIKILSPRENSWTGEKRWNPRIRVCPLHSMTFASELAAQMFLSESQQASLLNALRVGDANGVPMDFGSGGLEEWLTSLSDIEEWLRGSN